MVIAFRTGTSFILNPFARKYDSGAVGSFTHVVALQGTNYSCELEVYADGYSLKWVLDTPTWLLMLMLV